MNTRNHEDIAMTAGPVFVRGAFAKDRRSLEAPCLGEPHSCSKRRKRD